MPNDAEFKNVTGRVHKHAYRKARHLAADRDCTVSDIVNEALTAYLRAFPSSWEGQGRG